MIEVKLLTSDVILATAVAAVAASISSISSACQSVCLSVCQCGRITGTMRQTDTQLADVRDLSDKCQTMSGSAKPRWTGLLQHPDHHLPTQRRSLHLCTAAITSISAFLATDF